MEQSRSAWPPVKAKKSWTSRMLALGGKGMSCGLSSKLPANTAVAVIVGADVAVGAGVGTAVATAVGSIVIVFSI